jgi:hypothetical protein
MKNALFIVSLATYGADDVKKKNYIREVAGSKLGNDVGCPD